MSGSQTRRRVTHTQLLHLWEFLSNHKEVAVGYNKSAQAREHSKKMWNEAAQRLNSTGDGAIKTASEWSKYWVDMKAKIKRKNRLINEARRRTGGGPCPDELSEMEQNFLDLLGSDYGSGLPGVRVEPIVTQHEQQEHEDNDHPTGSTSSQQEAIYLNIETSDNSINNEHLAEEQSQSLPTMAEFSPPSAIVEPLQSLPSTAASPPAEPGARRRQRRQRQGPRLTAQDARQRLVSASQMRAQAELANSRSLARAVGLLGDVVSILQRLEARLTENV